jgi:uncharacterized protein (DUF488 family)
MWTIGHSTRSLRELIALLGEHRVARLADVRRIPRSRRHPHFDAEALARDLPAAGIAYVHASGLGGFRTPRADSVNTAWRTPAFRGYADYMQTPEFATHLDALVLAAATVPTAVMCAEALPSRCHRALLADALLVRGLEVRHILGPGRVETHTLTPDARVLDGRLSYPGEPELFQTG